MFKDKKNQNGIEKKNRFAEHGKDFVSALLLCFTICIFSLASGVFVKAEEGWVNREGNWYYYPSAEEAHYTGWIRSEDSGRWYYIVDGQMQTGWASWKGKWYFLNADGGMAEKQWVGNFYVGEDGAVLTNTETPDGWKLSGNGSYLLKGKPTEELNEKTARYIKVLMEHPDARAVFDSPSQLVLENGNGYPFVIFKKMSLYDSKTSELLYEGDAGFHRNAVLEYYDGEELKLMQTMDFMQRHYLSGKQVLIDPAGLITYVVGEKR